MTVKVCEPGATCALALSWNGTLPPADVVVATGLSTVTAPCSGDRTTVSFWALVEFTVAVIVAEGPPGGRLTPAAGLTVNAGVAALTYTNTSAGWLGVAG